MRRPKNVYGSPWEKDGTAGIERAVERGGQRAANMMQKWSSDVFPRPVGSRKVSPEMEVAEFDMIKDDPQMLVSLASERDWSLETFVDYLEEMVRRSGGTS